MTDAPVTSPPGWGAFVVRASLLSLVVFLAAAGPFWAWLGTSGLAVLGLAGGLELILMVISYAFLEASFRRSPGFQYYAILGGWVVRSGPTIAVLYVLWKWTSISPTGLLVSVMIFYLTLLFYEAKVCWDARGTS